MTHEQPIERSRDLDEFIKQVAKDLQDPEGEELVTMSGHITTLPDGNAIIFHGIKTIFLSRNGDTLNLEHIKFEGVSRDDKRGEPLFSLVLWDHLFFFFWNSPVVCVKLQDFLLGPGVPLECSSDSSQDVDVYRYGSGFKESLFVVNSKGRISRAVDISLIGSKLCDNVEIRSIATGKNHLICLSTSGRVLGLGCNRYGQCGFSDDCQTIGSLVRLEEIVLSEFTHESFFPVKVSCGYNHSCVLSDDGTMVTFGDNSYGQLCRRSPELIGFADVPLIRGIACAADYSVCTRTCDESYLFTITDTEERSKKFKDSLDITVQLVGFGFNSHGQLADGENSIGLTVDGSAVCFIRVNEEGPYLTDQCELTLFAAYPEFLFALSVCGEVFISGKFFAEDDLRPYLIDCSVLMGV